MTVKFEMVGNSIGRLTIANPPSNNLIRPDFMPQDELERIVALPELKGLLIRGAGRHFSSGASLEALATQRRNGQLSSAIDRGKQLLATINRATVPVVAVIRGACLGAGLEIAMACHFRHAARNALLGFPELGHGFIPGMGASVFGPGILPPAGLMELMLSARLVLGEEAINLGLVDAVADSAELEAEAMAWLENLTSRHSPVLIRAALASIHDGRFLPRDQALANESRRFFELIQNAELHD